MLDVDGSLIMQPVAHGTLHDVLLIDSRGTADAVQLASLALGEHVDWMGLGVAEHVDEELLHLDLGDELLVGAALAWGGEVQYVTIGASHWIPHTYRLVRGRDGVQPPCGLVDV